jgi:hypothetical protein
MMEPQAEKDFAGFLAYEDKAVTEASETLEDIERDILGLHRILARFVNIENRAARLQHAEMVALHSEQRAIHNVVVGIMPEDHIWPHDLFAVFGQC